jgi:hemerythrin superfamily protein
LAGTASTGLALTCEAQDKQSIGLPQLASKVLYLDTSLWRKLCSRTRQEETMDALELLKQDHQKVKKLLTSATETKDKNEQKRLFKEIKTELDTHARLEETIFYPAVQEHEDLKAMVFESLEEHRQVKTLLRELSRATAGSDKFKAKLKVLNDDVEHHAEEEEEGKMFPKVRKAFDSKELEELGQELEAAKQKKRLRKAS